MKLQVQQRRESSVLAYRLLSSQVALLRGVKHFGLIYDRRNQERERFGFAIQ